MITVSEAFRKGYHCDYVPAIAFNDGVEETPIWNITKLDAEHFQIALWTDRQVIVPGSDLLAEFDVYYTEEGLSNVPMGN